MSYFISHIAKTLNAKARIVTDNSIDYIFFDSRKIFSPGYVFIHCIERPAKDGHKFITELYKQGVRNFIVCEEMKQRRCSGSKYIICSRCI